MRKRISAVSQQIFQRQRRRQQAAVNRVQYQQQPQFQRRANNNVQRIPQRRNNQRQQNRQMTGGRRFNQQRLGFSNQRKFPLPFYIFLYMRLYLTQLLSFFVRRIWRPASASRTQEPKPADGSCQQQCPGPTPTTVYPTGSCTHSCSKRRAQEQQDLRRRARS